MAYKNFEVTIGGSMEKGRFSVLGDSPAGGFTGSFVNPITDDDLEHLVSLGLRVRSAGDTGETKPVESAGDIEDMGDRLSKALFQDKILGAYNESKGRAAEEGLRIRIRIDPTIKGYAKLMNLPWEFLKDVQTGDRIELKRKGAIVRNPITPVRPGSFSIEAPLRILVAIYQPPDRTPLQLDEEILSFSEQGQVPGIEVYFLNDVTLPALKDKMNDGEYHIFHFIGHGGVNDKGKSALIFKDSENEENRFITSDELKIALSDSVRLVFLNACATANIPVVDPFAAFPTELLKSGIPAVVAMQFPISNEAATIFCKDFYTCIAKGIPIDQCMGEARRGIFVTSKKKEWGTPVLFMNLSEGQLFDIGKQEAEQKQAND